MLTNCGYRVLEETVCNGSRFVDPKLCDYCPSNTTSLFYTKKGGVFVNKRVVVNVHAFGVTIEATH